MNVPSHIQIELPLQPNQAEPVRTVVLEFLRKGQQPSAWDLLTAVETKVGLRARWALLEVLELMAQEREMPGDLRMYCRSMRASDELAEALRGVGAPKSEIASSIDSLLQQSHAYRVSAEFQEMVNFIGKFRDYAPYNNMLVRLQNPSCSFYATEGDWVRRFGRTLKEDARPLLILAPMHPVMLVYDVDQTEGTVLPKEVLEFSSFEGPWKAEWLRLTIENAAMHDKIRIDIKKLSSTNSGFATIATGDKKWKMRIVIHEGLDEPSRFGVLCHELAHVYLGHLGSDKDHWWPGRRELNYRSVEIEAEAVAFIMASRFGLQGSSARYVSRYLEKEGMPESVSLDHIAKVAGRLERMAKETLRPRRAKPAGKKQQL